MQLRQRIAATAAALLIAVSALGHAKEPAKYVVSEIPEELKQNVNLVFWQDASVYQINSESNAVFSVKRAITILNPNGKDAAMVLIGYDKLTKVLSFKGTVYDANGAVVRKIKPSQIIDHVAYDGVSLFSDNRVKRMDLSYGSYPYTVEYEYEIEQKFLFAIPSFELLEDENQSALSVEFTIVYPKHLKPRYHATNMQKAPEVIARPDGTEATSWRFENVKPVRFEPMGPASQIPSVEFAPSTFSYDGYKGNMDTWQNFGKWINSLLAGRNTLPEETKNKIVQLTGQLRTPEEKVKAVYEYMQNKTRYVGIQLGIGGLQPFGADVVDQVGYGDCKGLSNYMVSLLSAINIKSHYVLVNSGSAAPELNTTFVSSQFDHVIVCVPLEKDTIWLECTSQTAPFGYMGRFTGNRKALAITDDGARVVSTPRYSEKENLQLRRAEVTVSETGDATAKVVTTFTGLQYENDNLDGILRQNRDEQKKWIQENTEIPVFNVTAFTMTDKKGRLPSAVVTSDLSLAKLASVSGKRLFLTPNLMNRPSFIPPKVENRKTPFYMRIPYTDIDSVVYNIPEKIFPEYLPPKVSIQSEFGSYEADFKVDQGKLIYTRRMVRKSGKFPAEKYPEFMDFCKAVTKADNVKVVFLTKT